MAQKSQKISSKSKKNVSAIGFYKPLLGVLIITFLAFSNFSSLDFVSYDDGAYVFDNPVIKSLSFKNIATIFTSFSNANYHPLTILTYAFEFQLFGLNATGYHFINILLHLINTALVFLLILKISKRNEIAIICALFFGIHPMHVESVIWVSELKDLLYSMFYLGAIYYYCKYMKNSSAPNYFAVIAFFVLSLLSKSAAITLPLVLCAFDFYFHRGISKKVILEKIPFVILSGVFCIITVMSQKSIGAINTDWMPKYSLIERFFVVSYGVCFYIWELFLPIGLSAIHYAPKIIPSYFYVMPILLAVLAVSIWKAKILKREIVFGMAFYLFSICLTLQIIPVGYAIVSERYSYLPYIGLLFVIGSFYVAIVDGQILWAKKLVPYVNYVFIAFAVICFAVTYNRNQVWKDGISLYKDIVEKYPNVSYAHFSMGQNFQATGALNDGLASFNRSIELDPTSAEVYFFRGTLLYAQKNYEAAVKDFKTAIALKPKYIEAIYNLGVCYSTMGNYQESINTTTKSIDLKPNQQMYESRAKAFFNLKKYKEAADDFSNALKLDPKSAESLFYRGISFYNCNKRDSACTDLKQASSLGYLNANEYINSYCK